MEPENELFDVRLLNGMIRVQDFQRYQFSLTETVSGLIEATMTLKTLSRYVYFRIKATIVTAQHCTRLRIAT